MLKPVILRRDEVKKLRSKRQFSKKIDKTSEKVLDISRDAIFRDILEIVSFAWQFPKMTGIKITYGNRIYTTNNFRETHWKISEISPIVMRCT